jgi:hypothetical protein
MQVTFCSCGGCTNFVKVIMWPLGPVLDKCYKCFAKCCEHGKPTEQDYKLKGGEQFVGNKWAQLPRTVDDARQPNQKSVD